MGGSDGRKAVHDGEILASSFGDGSSSLQGFPGFDFCSYGGSTTPSSLASIHWCSGWVVVSR
jgi:hypothetical protein